MKGPSTVHLFGRLSHAFRRLSLLLALSTGALQADGMAGTTAYMATTHHLNLNHVEFLVVAPPEWTAHVDDRARTLFAEAGLTLSPPTTDRRWIAATLTLTLDPRALREACPGKVLYAPSLSLVEPVVIPRNAAVIRDTSWLLGTDRQVRDPVGIAQLDADADHLIRQFITDYKAGNPDRRSQESLAGGPRDGHEPAPPLRPEANGAQREASLNDLGDSRLQLSVMAGPATERLRSRALQHLRDAGLRVSSDHTDTDTGTVTVQLELTQRSLEEQCPGRVLYEQGLYLVEPVQLPRNPSVRFWSDTWLRETVGVVRPVSPRQIDSDHDALLYELLRSFQSN